MTRLGLKYLTFIIIIYILSQAIDTIYVANDITILILGVALIIVNMLIKPLLLLITFPLSMLTFGLFSLVVNAWTIMLADFFVPGINMGGFLNSLLAAILIVIVNHAFINKKRMG